MPYISPKRVKEIRNEIKSLYPDFKFSITTKHYSSVYIIIKSGPVELITIPEDTKRYQQVNHYYIAEHYKDEPEVRDMLQNIYNIANKGNGTEVEDGDYGRVPNFYLHIQIGDWNSPYQLIS